MYLNRVYFLFDFSYFVLKRKASTGGFEPLLVILIKKKRICRRVDLAVRADSKVRIKESEKTDKYLDHVKELKKVRNMRVTVIPIVIEALGTVPKGLEKGMEELEIDGRIKTIQIPALLRSARILR